MKQNLAKGHKNIFMWCSRCGKTYNLDDFNITANETIETRMWHLLDIVMAMKLDTNGDGRALRRCTKHIRKFHLKGFSIKIF